MNDVCFFHSQVDKKWQWSLTDGFGRSIKLFGKKFDTYNEAKQSYEENNEEFQKGLYPPNDPRSK